jgi:hypothetical protein
VPTLFDGELHVHYGQFYIESRIDDFFGDLTEALGGQANGLCGAAVPGFLYLITGLHTGNVHLTVELLDAAPPVGDGWEDVVEVSFRPETAKVVLVQWAGEASWPLALAPLSYRVRYSVSGMDQAHAQDTRMDEDPALDRYLLQLWPAPAAPDEIIRQTSEGAAYWHEVAQFRPAPPSPEERAAAQEQERLAREEAGRQAALAAELRRWGGRLPDERVRQVNGATVLAELDRDLLDSMAELDDAALRVLAIWTARRACAEAGLNDVAWVRNALAALANGKPLPPPFDDRKTAFELLLSDPLVPSSTVRSYDGRFERFSQQHGALPAIWAASGAEPLAAAVEAVFHTIVTFGEHYPRLLAELHRSITAG